MTAWLWVHLVVATLAISTYGQSYRRGPTEDDLVNGICQRKYIRNDPAKLEESLRGCRVIEGSLQIALVNSNSSDSWSNLSYPELREITGYLLIFDIHKLTSLRTLFPNLAVIRGQELIDTHALMISTGNELQEIGLPSLTDIQRGSVWIVDNPHLCYVETIEWHLISNQSTSDSGIAKNKPSEQCPNTCKQSCPKSEISNKHLCWSNRDCQRVFKDICPHCDGRPCVDHNHRECCSHQCLGGCSGPSPRDCYVCKHVIFNGTCTEECPPGFYEYLQRRCVTRDECLNIVATPDVSKKGSRKLLEGKLYESNGKKMCVLDCPVGTELAPNKTACVPCKGTCKKNCPGTLVDSVEKARELKGCTRITGILKISIRRSSSITTGTIVKELKQNLDKIEEIDHHLVITHTYAIVSLDFLENLKIIRGNVLEDDRYALVVRSNENLMELWDSRPNRKIIIENKASRVLFHYNPKLCPQKIWELVAQSGIKQPKDDKIDIGITNGDKVTCNTQILNVEIEKKTNNSVLIRYENFRRNLTLTSHLLSYEIHYKEAPDYPSKNVSKYDDRDPCGDDDWTILEYPKISDADVRGGIQNEPVWEHSRLIANLKHYAWYALYVKTIVIPDENSLNNNTGAESNIIYFQTLPGVPTKPQDFVLTTGGPNTVTLTWTPPAHANGELEKYVIWLEPVREDQSVQDQRNFCKQGRQTPKVVSPIVKSTPAPKGSDMITLSTRPKDSDCCSCSAGASAGKTTPPSYESVHYQDQMMNEIINHVFIAQSDSFQDTKGDLDNNNIRVRRKRSFQQLLKGTVDDSSSDNTSGEKIGDMVFPGEDNSPGMDQPRVPPGMYKYQEVKVDHARSSYILSLKNLSHFTTYSIGIQACRAVDRNLYLESNATEVENDTRTCSDILTSRIQTAPSPTADTIDPRTIITNVTDGNYLHLSWQEPPNPNGPVLAFYVRVERWDGSKYVDIPKEVCINRKDYHAKRNFTFPDPLHPGNYSVRIRVSSLAQDSEYTVDRYFLIEDTNKGQAGMYVLASLVSLAVLFICLVASMYYYFRQKGIIDGRRIFSANPEYMSNVDIPEEWEVPREQLTILKDKPLGQGSFGTVFEGILRDFINGSPNFRCAVKTVADGTSSEEKALFLREAALMVKLECRCHHVVKLLGVISKTQPTYVIMELMAKGDLKNYLRSRRPGTYNSGEPPPTLKQILRMAAEIADGMSYIHKNKLVHRDLAARNCMVAEDLCVKVGDFGMTKEVLQSDYYRKQTRGLLPVRWMAPESLRDGVFTNQSDVWSFGVVLWEMATLAAQPYQGLSNSQVLEYVMGGRTMERPENCPDILFDLMTLCWQTEPRHRPNFVQIIEEKLLRDLDESFAQVSFFHSAEGQSYREQLKLQSRDEALIEIRFDSLTPLATLDDDDDDLDDYDSNDELNHQIVDDLGDTPSRLLLGSPPSSATITSRTPLINGLALNPLVIHSPRTTDSTTSESVNLANHALPAPTSSTSNLYSTSRNSGGSGSNSNYSPRPRTNSNNNNTNPRLPISLNFQNNSIACSNLNRGGGGSTSSYSSGIPVTQTGSSSSLSSSTTNFASPIPNGVDSSYPFHHSAAGITTSSPKCSLQNKTSSGDSSKLEQSKANAYNSSGGASTDNSQALMINYSGDGNNSKLSNGSGGVSAAGGGNGYIKRRGSPLAENQPVNRTTQC